MNKIILYTILTIINIQLILAATPAGEVYHPILYTDSIQPHTGTDPINIETGISIGSATQTVGTNSMAMGSNADASGANSLAIGFNAASTGLESVAIGRDSLASVTWATAIGFNAQATGLQSTAIGRDTLAELAFATAIGYNAHASKSRAIAIGDIQVDATDSVGIAAGASGDVITTTGVIALTGGNVGVNNIDPQSELDVDGTIRAQEICDEAGANCKDVSTGWSGSGSSVWTESGSDIYRDTGLVGIGTTTPLELLHLAGTLRVDGTSENGITFPTTNNIEWGTDYPRIRGDTTTNNLELSTGATQATVEIKDTVVEITSANVGIDVANPDAALDVSGDIEVSGDIDVEGELRIGEDSAFIRYVAGSSCPAGSVEIARNWAPKTCTGPGCGSGACTTTGGWFDEAPTCIYTTLAISSCINSAICTADTALAVVCIGE